MNSKTRVHRKSSYGRRGRLVLVILWLVFLNSYVMRLSFPAALPTIARELSLSPAQAGALLSIFFVGYGVLQVPSGILVDRSSPKRVITIAVLLWSVFAGLMGATGTFLSLLATRFLFGCGQALHPPASWKTISNWFQPGLRSSANAWVLSAMALGAGIAPPLAVALVERWGWRNAFYLLSVSGFAVATSIHLFLSDTPAEATDQSQRTEVAESQPTAAASTGSVLKTKNLWALVLSYHTFACGYWGFISWLPSYLVQERHFSFIEMGPLAALPFLAAFVTMLVVGRWADNASPKMRKLIVTSSWALSGVAIYLTFAAAREAIAMLLLIAAGALLFAPYGAFWALMMDATPAASVGLSSGVINLAAQVGGSLAPLAIGYLLAWTGSFQSGFALMAVELGLSAVFVSTVSVKQQSEAPIGDS